MTKRTSRANAATRPPHPHKRLIPRQQALARVVSNYRIAGTLIDTRAAIITQDAIVQTWAEVTNQTWLDGEREILRFIEKGRT